MRSLASIAHATTIVPQAAARRAAGTTAKAVLRVTPIAVVIFATLLAAAAEPVRACTNFIATKGATTDGSVTITYTCDGEFHPRMRYYPAEDHEPGSVVEIKDWSENTNGTVRQVPHTYAVNYLMNEHQLVIGETTFDGREELAKPRRSAPLLEAHAARPAAGEDGARGRRCHDQPRRRIRLPEHRRVLFHCRSHEVWILEMIGPGPGGEGAHGWRVRVPDGTVCAHANMARIGEFPLDDPETSLFGQRHLVCRRQRLLRSRIAASPSTSRRSTTRHAPEEALHGNPGVEPASTRRALAGVSSRLSIGASPARSAIPSGSSPTRRYRPGRRVRASCATTTRAPTST